MKFHINHNTNKIHNNISNRIKQVLLFVLCLTGILFIYSVSLSTAACTGVKVEAQSSYPLTSP